MKIRTENMIYVQKKDLVFLRTTGLLIPDTIETELKGMDYSNLYEFVKFETINEILFFDTLDWIIDYNSLKDFSKDELIKMAITIAKEKNKIDDLFHSLSEEDRQKHLDMVTECKLLDFKIDSLKEFLWFIEGRLDVTLPEGVNSPTLGKKEKRTIFKLIRKIF